jgi:hypothetical protein
MRTEIKEIFDSEWYLWVPMGIALVGLFFYFVGWTDVNSVGEYFSPIMLIALLVLLYRVISAGVRKGVIAAHTDILIAELNVALGIQNSSTDDADEATLVELDNELKEIKQALNEK